MLFFFRSWPFDQQKCFTMVGHRKNRKSNYFKCRGRVWGGSNFFIQFLGVSYQFKNLVKNIFKSPDTSTDTFGCFTKYIFAIFATVNHSKVNLFDLVNWHRPFSLSVACLCGAKKQQSLLFKEMVGAKNFINNTNVAHFKTQ